MTGERGRDDPNHTTARKPASLQTIQYSLDGRVCICECRQRPNPKSLTGGQSRLWHRVSHGKCVCVDSGVDIR